MMNDRDVTIISLVREQEKSYFESDKQFDLSKLLKDLDTYRKNKNLTKDKLYRSIARINDGFIKYYGDIKNTITIEEPESRFEFVQKSYDKLKGGYHYTYVPKGNLYRISDRDLLESRQNTILKNKSLNLEKTLENSAIIENDIVTICICSKLLLSEWKFCPYCGDEVIAKKEL